MELEVCQTARKSNTFRPMPIRVWGVAQYGVMFKHVVQHDIILRELEAPFKHGQKALAPAHLPDQLLHLAELVQELVHLLGGGATPPGYPPPPAAVTPG